MIESDLMVRQEKINRIDKKKKVGAHNWFDQYINN